jgi:hypothetical protein
MNFISDEVPLEAEAESSHLPAAIVSRAVEITQDGERTGLQVHDPDCSLLGESNSEICLAVDRATCQDPGSMKLNKEEGAESHAHPLDEAGEKKKEQSKGLSVDVVVESGGRIDTACELQTLNRRRLWLELFTKRPQDLGNGVDAWLSQVLAVSDPSRSWNIEGDKVDEADLKGNTNSDAMDVAGKHEPTANSSQVAEWLSLLGTRPHKSVEGSKATAWLKRVLEVSCQDFGVNNN